MLDTLETAKSHGLAVRIPGEAERVSTDELAFHDFDGLMAGWQAVTVALNSLSRSMGLKDVYPFVLSQTVREKLGFIHDLVHECAGKPFAGIGAADAQATAELEPKPSKPAPARPPTEAAQQP
jgi:hypothetical protein